MTEYTTCRNCNSTSIYESGFCKKCYYLHPCNLCKHGTDKILDICQRDNCKEIPAHECVGEDWKLWKKLKKI